MRLTCHRFCYYDTISRAVLFLSCAPICSAAVLQKACTGGAAPIVLTVVDVSSSNIPSSQFSKIANTAAGKATFEVQQVHSLLPHMQRLDPLSISDNSLQSSDASFLKYRFKPSLCQTRSQTVLKQRHEQVTQGERQSLIAT